MDVSTEQHTLFSKELMEGPRGAGALAVLRERVIGCNRCGLASSRKNAVFGEGEASDPLIMFVGEGPGANEDEMGRPFVGTAGQLLDRMIEAMHLKREQVYVCNVVCCRPPGNRAPEANEVASCETYLLGQVRAIQPKAIVALGLTAAQALLKKRKPLEDLRGKWHKVDGFPTRVTFHPAYLLRPQGRASKPYAWNDLQEVLKLLDDHVVGRG
jgi:DNA polymerase